MVIQNIPFYLKKKVGQYVQIYILKQKQKIITCNLQKTYSDSYVLILDI